MLLRVSRMCRPSGCVDLRGLSDAIEGVGKLNIF